MKDKGPDALFQYAIRILAARAYSEAVLRRKLTRRAQPGVVEPVIGQLKALGYLEDAQYAEGYARMYAGRWGRAKVRRGLLQKGVSPAVVDRVLGQLEPENDPVSQAVGLLERHQARYKGNKSKAIRFLVGRGFALGEALEAWQRFTSPG